MQKSAPFEDWNDQTSLFIGSLPDVAIVNNYVSQPEQIYNTDARKIISGPSSYRS